MLEVTETEETICHICIIGSILIGGEPLASLHTPLGPGLFRPVQSFNFTLSL